ncbi:MAG: ABC transporter ATP-binding protein/permease [Roseburia sp.]|nr:ABC transporter ATP-binding protein/permease [Roseburia sp.]MCM1098010.1 ABC transporter ATP-binding protein/permease [Ruminococcus flavefaciens]
MSTKSEKMSWRKAIGINIRAVRLLASKNKWMFPYGALKALLDVTASYAGLVIMAKLIGELAGDRRPETLGMWALVSVLTTAAFGIVKGAMYHAYSAKSALFWANMQRMECEKFMTMDYGDVENQEVRDLYNQITQNRNWGGWGFARIQWAFEGFVSDFFSVIGALALSVGLFVARVPEGSDLVFLNHPLTVLGVFGAMAFTASLAPWLNAKMMAKNAAMSGQATLGNRLFSHFGFLNDDADSMVEYRMYPQAKIARHYTWMDNIWFVGGYCDKQYKGSFGLCLMGKAAGEKLLLSVIYLFVCLKAWAGAFGIGEVTQYVGAMSRLVSGVTRFLNTANELRVNAGFVEKIFEFLDLPSHMYQGSLTTEKRRDRKYNVEFKNVSFRYPGSEKWALKNVSVRFEVGSKLAVVGENGSGKSTFIKLLCRLYDPQEGEILLNGVDIKKYRYEEYMAIFSVVFQDFSLLSHQLGQNVAGSCDVDEERAVRCLEDAGFGDRLKELPDGLNTWLYKDFDEEGIEISGGERQKIAIARALYKDAPFIILDEPTASLDPIAEAEIYRKFDEIAGDRTAVYISHRLSSCRFCKEILVFEDGGIIQQGDHEGLLKTEGKYRQLWEAQAQYYEKSRQYEADRKYL